MLTPWGFVRVTLLTPRVAILSADKVLVLKLDLALSGGEVPAALLWLEPNQSDPPGCLSIKGI